MHQVFWGFGEYKKAPQRHVWKYSQRAADHMVHSCNNPTHKKNAVWVRGASHMSYSFRYSFKVVDQSHLKFCQKNVKVLLYVQSCEF